MQREAIYTPGNAAGFPNAYWVLLKRKDDVTVINMPLSQLLFAGIKFKMSEYLQTNNKVDQFKH